ncbi:hypothetical protein [Hydrotalea sp.]|uniref:hypothetical protein n=1 Tax=Hydrotalea sp. TaxID=2881279 RepID=UPI00262BB00C|nr:hypothetical protein [Hydrotalea sp.]
MKKLRLPIQSLFLLAFLSFYSVTMAQDNTDWPKVITANDGSIIRIYQPQPESLSGDILKFRAALSVQNSNNEEPVFGTFWSVATISTDRDNRLVHLLSAQVPNLKLSSDSDLNHIAYLKTTLETQLPKAGIVLPMDQLLTQLDNNLEQHKLAQNFDNNPPHIIYANRPSIMVLIDGEPKMKKNPNWGLDAVVNTPYTMVQNTDGQFYLYGAKHWYSAPGATGPYMPANNPPANLSKIAGAVDAANDAQAGYSSNLDKSGDNVYTGFSNIIVSTKPAELIQTSGEPNMLPIDNTSLLYAANSNNDIFLDTNTQQYYILISGRWYTSNNLNGNWQYIAANDIPADFAKIPEGSPKDNVLASVPGTYAAKEAIMDAQIPQTAKVDRNKAAADVTYDGEPRFKPIEGTNLQYAVNTASSVVRYGNQYYTVESGVWFVAPAPNGPWSVATERPSEIDIIPPSYPVYNLKYVYIYDVTPDWVYMGYTPGYLNTFVYGPTVVYGTGYYYRPWWGNYYYPRSYTWGFSMMYNPWYGWGMGFSYGFGWFNTGFGTSIWNGWAGGWWGPGIYHPPYCWSPRNYGFYGRNAGGFERRPIVINNNRFVTNNIYTYRHDVITSNRYVSNNRNVNIRNDRYNYNYNGGNIRNNNFGNDRNIRGEHVQPNMPNNVAGENTILSDRQGNVYRNQQGRWEQRTLQRQWTPINNNHQEVIRNLDRQQAMQQRGQARFQNFQMNRPAPAQRSAPAPSGGGGGGNNNNRGGRGGH